MSLADDENYRERRYFTSWTKIKQIEEYTLPLFIQEVTRQETVPFGDGIIQARDVTLGSEICEELWTAYA